MLKAVHGLQRFQISLQFLGQGLKGAGGAGPGRVAADGRDLARVQHRAGGWIGLKGDVRVPLVGAVARHVGGFLKQLDRFVPLKPGEERLGLVRIAEHLGHVQLLVGREGLLAEEQHLEFGQGAAQFGAQGFVPHIGKVYAVHGGADQRVIGLDLQLGVAGQTGIHMRHENFLCLE